MHFILSRVVGRGMSKQITTAIKTTRAYSTNPSLTKRSEAKCFGGSVVFYTHESSETKTPMNFSVYLPPKAGGDNPECPVVYWLSGLTCTDENFITKAGAQRVAAELGLILVCPDTSPRGCNIEGEDNTYDFGAGAGFYVDATLEKWSNNYRMYSYVTQELPTLVESSFPVVKDCRSIFGHSMGGHGALISALKNPGFYKSVSAFAPICNPTKCAWGVRAFAGYLGNTTEKWNEYDACELAASYSGPNLQILADQGSEDNFLKQGQLLPENLVAACEGNGNVVLTSREQLGYDHSYYFIATFVEEHLRFHSSILKGSSSF